MPEGSIDKALMIKRIPLTFPVEYVLFFVSSREMSKMFFRGSAWGCCIPSYQLNFRPFPSYQLVVTNLSFYFKRVFFFRFVSY